MNDPAKVIVPGATATASGVGFSVAQFNEYLQSGALIFAILSGIFTAYRFWYWWTKERKK